MNTRKQVPTEEWQERLQMLSSGNKGRSAAIAAEGMTIAENQPLRNLEYDPVGKGNDLIIAVGEGDSNVRHTISAPVELFIEQDDQGVVNTIEIVDQNGEKTFIRMLNV